MNFKKFFRSYSELSLLSIFILGIILSLRTILDIDIGFHLRGGEWILQNLSFHKFDVFTYTVNQNEYIAIHWLYQVIIFFVFKLFNYAGLSFFNLILILSILLSLTYLFKINQVNPLNISICLLLFILGSEYRFIFRPEIITWLFIILTIIILDLYYSNKRNILCLLPIIFLLWVNLHGLFYIGIFTIISYFVGILIHKKSFDKKLFFWGTLSFIVLFVNPYFLNGVTFPFYLATRLDNSNIFKNIISELKSPFSIGFSNDPLFPIVCLYTFYISIFLCVVSIVINYKNLKLQNYLLLFFTFYIAYSLLEMCLFF